MFLEVNYKRKWGRVRMPCFQVACSLDQCFLNLKMYLNLLSVLWTCRFEFSESRLGPESTCLTTSCVVYMLLVHGPHLEMQQSQLVILNMHRSLPGNDLWHAFANAFIMIITELNNGIVII